MEQWKSVYGWGRFYEVSDHGRVRSKRTGKLITQRPHWQKGYMQCDLVRNVDGVRTRKTIAVHRLVCRAFHGPSPQRGCEVDHLDRNRQNNRAGNLEWCTGAENIARRDARRRVEFLDPVPF